MKEFTIKNLVSKNIEEELKLIGFDEGYRFVASEKFKYKNLKIYNLTSTQANILKQTALTVGTDCGTHREVICGGIEASDVIIGGSISQLKKIAEKLKLQPFNLKELAVQILQKLETDKRKTKLVGILNITPNSFSDGGKYFESKKAIAHLLQLIEDGADLIDIGAESTKPFSEGVSSEEQIARLKPVLEYIQNNNISIPISVDTRSSEVAEFALDCGVQIINDVSGFDYDEKMVEVISKYQAGVIIQHSKGTPENMQNSPVYTNVVEEIFTNLNKKKNKAKEYGIKNVILDIGIGFGKTKEHNFELLDRIEEFYSLGCPLMVGVSRKTLLGVNEDDNDIKDALTLGISYPLIQKGVDYLRVHNVKLHKKLLEMRAY